MRHVVISNVGIIIILPKSRILVVNFLGGREGCTAEVEG